MIRVASFNVKNLNMGKDEESLKERDYDRIVSLIRNYDIVVLQEVLTPKIIEGFSGRLETALLPKKLGGTWRGKWVDPQTNSSTYPFLGGDKRGEGYAFLWNTKSVELLQDENGKEIVPKRYSHYRAGEEQIRLMRDPGYGRFKLKNRPVEIRVITTHIIFGKPKKENILNELDIGAIKMRRNEFNLLAGKIYKSINENRNDNHINAVYTIIVGDYNLNLKGGEISTATMPAVCCYDNNGNVCESGINNIRTVQDAPTTIKADYSGYANNYDHCSYSTKFESVIGDCYRISAIENTDSVEMIREYRDKVSDHVPIVVEIKC